MGVHPTLSSPPAMKFLTLFVISVLCWLPCISTDSVSTGTFLYDSPQDCVNAASTLSYNGECYLSSDCSRGAFNLTATSGMCQLANAGPVVSIGMYNFGAVQLLFDTSANCNSSFQTMYTFTHSNTYNDCRLYKAYSVTSVNTKYQFSTEECDGVRRVNFTSY